MRHSVLPTRRDLANTAVSTVVGAAAIALLAADQRRRSAVDTPQEAEAAPSTRTPDDAAWHAAMASNHPPRI